MQEICPGCLICIFPSGGQASIIQFDFPHWQEVLVLLLKIRSGCRLILSIFLILCTAGLWEGFHPVAALPEILTIRSLGRVLVVTVL